MRENETVTKWHPEINGPLFNSWSYNFERQSWNLPLWNLNLVLLITALRPTWTSKLTTRSRQFLLPNGGILTSSPPTSMTSAPMPLPRPHTLSSFLVLAPSETRHQISSAFININQCTRDESEICEMIEREVYCSGHDVPWYEKNRCRNCEIERGS